MSAALNVLLGRRLCEISGRMERLIARFEAGKLWRCKARVVLERVLVEVVPRVSARVWPTRFAWLVVLGAWGVAGCGGQLRIVLERPEMVALLLASPQAVRILTPLCRMLAVERSVLRPRVEGEVAVVRVPRVRVRRAPVVVDWGNIPLQPCVAAAVRAWKKRDE